MPGGGGTSRSFLFADGADSHLGSRSGEAGGGVRARNPSRRDGRHQRQGQGPHDVRHRGDELAVEPRPPVLHRFQRRIFVNLPAIEARQNPLELTPSR